MDSGPILGKTTTTITSAGSNDSPLAPTTATSGLVKLDKLLPKSITSSRRRKRSSQQPGALHDKQPSASDARPTSHTSSSSLSSTTADKDSLGDMLRGRSHRRDAAAAVDDDSGRSDDDISQRPRSISTQIAYLTTSSPLVQADHQDTRTQTVDPASDNIDRFSRASTFHPDSSHPVVSAHSTPSTQSAQSLSRKSSSNLDSSIPSLSSSKTGLAPPTSKSKNSRAPSPVGRFRSVFKKKSPAASIASADSHSPERSHPGESNDASTTFLPDDFSVAASASVPALAPVVDASAHQPGTSRVASTDRFRRLSRAQKVDTVVRPETPPATADNCPPVIVNTPPTPTEASYLSSTTATTTTTVTRPQTAATASSRDSAAHSQGFESSGSPTKSPSSSMLAQRRSRASSASLVPSKLSTITLAPLTPTPENGPNPSASGFFSTVISAAQNATSSLSSSITPWNNPGKKGQDQDDKSASSTTATDDDNARSQVDDDTVQVESSLGPSLVSTDSADSKEPAIKTLGQGDLSLSQLGITDQSYNANPTPTAPGANSAAVAALTSALANSNTAAMGAQTPVGASDAATDSRNRSESAPTDSVSFHGAAESLDQGSERSFPGGGRTGSMSDFAGHDTPPNASIYDDKQAEPIQRTSSISAIGRHRHRGSSAVSGGTIAAAIAAANASLAHPANNGSTPKLTGFAVASKKRNRDFHNLFKSVPDDDYLIEDYSCALQREILAHGRIYVSEGHLCFSSNILGWVTTLVMSFDEIVSVEKRSTALVFKNGLMISTLHAKHIFASFASRDSTYDLIVKIWKLGHPSLQSSVNGVHIAETGGDKTEKIEVGDAEEVSAGSRSASESEDESDEDSNDVYDEDDDDDELHDAALHSEPNSNGGSGGAGDAEIDKVVTRKVSGPAAMGGGGAGGAGGANGGSADKSKDAPAAAAGAAGADFPGPTTHAPTDCGDAGSHYDKILADEVIPAPLGKVFSYMFGTASVTFMPKWLSNDQKCFDIQMGDKKALGADIKTRTFSYIKPLNASIGPKQTKCIVTEQIDVLDFDKAIHILCSTQNPDVPNGNIFTVKTKYCLSWGEGNGTRVQMNCTTEWTGKSWIKVPIEKAANEGQAQYGRELFAGLKEALSSRARAGTGTAKGGKASGGSGNGKKGRKSKTAQASGGPASDSDRAVTGSVRKGSSAKSDWGLLEPVHGIVGPAIDILQPLLTGNVMYGLLVGLLVASWFGFRGGNAGTGVGHAGVGGVGGARRPFLPEPDRHFFPDRMAAYDEMWRREESELWDWLEERVGLDRLGKHEAPTAQQKKQQYQQHKRVEEKLREERMDEREIREAIRVTEEKLRVLKEVVDKRA